MCVIETYSTYFLSNRIHEFTAKPCDQKKNPLNKFLQKQPLKRKYTFNRCTRFVEHLLSETV